MNTAKHELPDTLFVALTGGPGSGKTALARMLHAPPLEDYPELQARYRKIQTHPMRSILRFAGMDLTSGPNMHTAMRSFHYEARVEGKDRAIMEQLRKFEPAAGIHIIDSVRHQNDALFVVRELGGIVVGLECDQDTRRERFMHDDDDEKHTTTSRNSPERHRAFDEAEREMWGSSENLYMSNIAMCMAYAQENGTIIDASGSKTDTFTNCLTLLQNIVVRASAVVQ